MYTITLSDGTKIQNLKLNGNNFISQTGIESSIFDGRLSTVTITDNETGDVQTMTNAELVQNQKYGAEWWFILRELSEQELKEMRKDADLDYCLMMVGE